MRYAIVRKSDGLVVNVIVLEDEGRYPVPDDYMLVRCDDCDIGDEYDVASGRFIKRWLLERWADTGIDASSVPSHLSDVVQNLVRKGLVRVNPNTKRLEIKVVEIDERRIEEAKRVFASDFVPKQFKKLRGNLVRGSRPA